MLKSTSDIDDFYQQNNEDMRLRRTQVNRIEFLTTVKYLEQVAPPGAKILDTCAGTGIYAFHLAGLGYKVTAGDLVDHNVEQVRQEQEKNPLLEQIYTGSILDLSIFEDESFDVVLNLGAYYHLTDEGDRQKAVEECLRVLKPGGIHGLAYLNRYANIIKFREQMTEDFDAVQEYLEKGYNADGALFYASTPDEIESLMAEFNLEQMHNLATDGLKFVIRDTINSLDDGDFAKWMELHYQTCEVKSLLGYSEHALYIGRKA